MKLNFIFGGPDPARRAFWLRHLHLWHWVSSAACLVGMLLFSATGITLNHAADIKATPRVTVADAVLPDVLRAELARTAKPGGKDGVPKELAAWARERLSVRLDGREAEWNDGEIYVSLPRAGGDAWLTADLTSGDVRYERTDRGWIAYLNDLHKGRNTGAAWKWFIDLFAAASIVFTVTGLGLLWFHSSGRPFTWPLVAFGLVLPVLITLLLIH